jgi:hypothetical protein
MDLVFAKVNTIIGHVQVHLGTHWPADDPFVIEHPDCFSADPRWGLVFSLEPPGYRDGTEDLTRPPPEPPRRVVQGRPAKPEPDPTRAPKVARQ